MNNNELLELRYFKRKTLEILAELEIYPVISEFFDGLTRTEVDFLMKGNATWTGLNPLQNAVKNFLDEKEKSEKCGYYSNVRGGNIDTKNERKQNEKRN